MMRSSFSHGVEFMLAFFRLKLLQPIGTDQPRSLLTGLQARGSTSQPESFVRAS
jgi:hypothetical protein